MNETKNNKIMTLKATKIILFAGLIAAMILPFSTIDFADAQTVNEENKNTQDDDIEAQTNETYQSQVNELTKQEFKDDIRELLGDAEDFESNSNEIKAEYDEFFSTVIEEARIDSETRNLTDVEIQEAKEYIFNETIKDEKLKALQESNVTDRIDVSFLDWFGIQTASAVCPSTTNPSYKQLSLDIDGGTFWLYTFEGNNDMYGYTYYDNSITCERTFVLYFTDEDHPLIDDLYDDIRMELYDRIYDIEMFSIQDNNQIEFDNTWSASNDYGCFIGSINAPGCHGTTTKTYTPGQTIYVSNTWNHMMDTTDTNPILSKVSVP